MFASRPVEPPVHVHASVPLLSSFESELVKSTLRGAIDGFESRIDRLEVFLEPRGRHAGEPGIRCHVSATLTEEQTLVVTCTASSIASASDAASRSLELALCRRLGSSDPMLMRALAPRPLASLGADG